MKWVVVGTIVLILFFLGQAGYYLIKDQSGGNKTVKALTWRIGLSVFLFCMLLVAFALGWLQPHAL